MTLTSLGSHLSNAALSTAFTDVWPETIAPNLVAEGMGVIEGLVKDEGLTWSTLFDDVIDKLSFD